MPHFPGIWAVICPGLQGFSAFSMAGDCLKSQVGPVGRGDPVLGLAAEGAGAATGAGGGSDGPERAEQRSWGGQMWGWENFLDLREMVDRLELR